MAIFKKKDKSAAAPAKEKPAKKGKKEKKAKDAAPAAKKSKEPKQPKQPKEPKPKAPKVKVPANIYTLVLLVAWLALVAACVLAYLDLASYK